MAVTVEQWDTFELAFESDRDYPNPFVDTDLSAVFRHQPTGQQVTVDGFYDGGRTWRLRFMPTERGEWQYVTSSQDGRLGGRRARSTAWAPARPTSTDHCGPKDTTSATPTAPVATS